MFVVVVFAFLMGYANRFLVRRRKREFGLYALLGSAWTLPIMAGVVGFTLAVMVAYYTMTCRSCARMLFGRGL